MNILKRSVTAAITGVIVFFILSLIGGMLLKMTPMPESWGFGYIIFIMSLICILEGLYMTAGAEKAGLALGILTGAVIIILIFTVVSLIFSGTLDMISMFRWQYLIPLFCGGAGGIMGVNIKK